jgi:sugar phosphate isomerase/epimerase
MKLATTTGDFGAYGATPAEQVRCFEGTGFRHLDLNLYRSIYLGSPMLDERWDGLVDEVAGAAAGLGFDFCQAHAPDGKLHVPGEAFTVFQKATIRSIETCGRLGIPAIVVHAQDIGGYPSRANRRENLLRNRAFFASLMPTMEKTGVQVLIENSCDTHAPTRRENPRNMPSTAAELLELVEFIDHPLIHVCWDTGHANIQGADPYQSLVELGGRLRGVHIADNYGDVDSHVAPFQGTTNLDAVMQGLIDSGYSGYFTFEAGNLLRNGSAWPHYRREWSYQGKPVTRLMDVPLALRRQAVALLYQIGRHMLATYDCLEEDDPPRAGEPPRPCKERKHAR